MEFRQSYNVLMLELWNLSYGIFKRSCEHFNNLCFRSGGFMLNLRLKMNEEYSSKLNQTCKSIQKCSILRRLWRRSIEHYSILKKTNRRLIEHCSRSGKTYKRSSKHCGRVLPVGSLASTRLEHVGRYLQKTFR